MANQAILFNAIFLALVLGAVKASHHLYGEHVCNKTVTIAREKTLDEPVRYEIKYRSMCGILPCTKTRTENRVDSKIVTYYEEVQVAQCCPGYTETPDRKCAPICLNSCANGKCISPGVCKCSPEPTETTPGFVGLTCSRFTCLAVDRWGAKCDRECSCPPTAYCSATTGKCLCRSGWRGANCTEECTASMSCEEGELPPIVEPEVNVISDEISTPQKLEFRTLEDDDTPTSRTVTSLVAAHMGLNLFLTILTFSLIFVIVRYKKRLNEIRNELYYGSYSGGSSSNGGGSEYSAAPSTNTLNRPRMPTPNEPTFLGKNLSFSTTTRAILQKSNQSSKQPETRVRFIVDPKIEAHLMASQANSEQNVYSDLESSHQTKPAFESVLVDNPNNSADHEYQVPRIVLATNMPIPHLDTLEDQTNHYENDNSIYEEIKPQSGHHDQRK